MTWSIVARDPQSGAFGVAVTTKAFACGARCPGAASGIGAISTQSFTNPMFATRGLRLLAEGLAADAVLDVLVASDDGEAIRQVHLVDARGRVAAHTGAGCVDWAGHKLGEGYSVAGNMLAGAAVVEATHATFGAARALPFAERFMAALEAGQAAGGDKRGKQSAVLLVYSTEEYADINLRVDDNPEPLAELRRLYEIYRRDYLPFKDIYPSKAKPAGLKDPAEIEALWRKHGRDMSFPKR